jgi:hypothetical protein
MMAARSSARLQFELRVAMAVRLFAVRGEEVAPARAHVARHVFHDDGDAVGFLVRRVEEIAVRIRQLRQRIFRQLLVLAEQA